MKRLIGLSIAVILAVTLTTVMLIPREAKAATAPQFTGIPLAIEFEGTLQIQSVLVEVKRGWVNGSDDAFALEIWINGVNGVPEFHGHQVVPLSSTTLFGNYGDVAHVIVAWDDPGSQNTGETYTVCVQVLVHGKPLGDLQCGVFL